MRVVSQSLNVNIVFNRLLSIIRTILEAIGIVPRITLGPCSILTTEASCAAYGCYYCSGTCQNTSCPVPPEPSYMPSGGGGFLFTPATKKEVKAVLDTEIRIETEQILPGDKVYASISLQKIEGPKGATNVNLSYWITDPYGTVVGSKATVVGVETTRTDVYFLTIPVGSPIGTYIFEALAKYNNVSDSSYETFLVVSKTKPVAISIKRIDLPSMTSGYNTSIKIILENLIEETIDANITLMLPKDFEPSEITKTISLEALEAGILEFHFIPRGLGSFSGFVSIEYNGRKIVRDFSFTVFSITMLYEPFLQYWWITILVIIVIIVIIIYKKFKRKEKVEYIYKREEYRESKIENI
jgi:hypothetical protein